MHTSIYRRLHLQQFFVMGFVSKVDAASLQAAAFASVAAAGRQTTNGGPALCPSFSALKCASARCNKNNHVSIQKAHKSGVLTSADPSHFSAEPSALGS